MSQAFGPSAAFAPLPSFPANASVVHASKLHFEPENFPSLLQIDSARHLVSPAAGIYTAHLFVDDPRVDLEGRVSELYCDVNSRPPYTTSSKSMKSAKPISNNSPFVENAHHRQMGALGDAEQADTLHLRRKRPSLQAIFVPRFLPLSPPSSPASAESSKGAAVRTSRQRSFSAAAKLTYKTITPTVPIPDVGSLATPKPSPPLTDLIDDDPFANLSSGPSLLYCPSASSSSSTSTVTTPRLSHVTYSPPSIPTTPLATPRSPLSPPASPDVHKTKQLKQHSPPPTLKASQSTDFPDRPRSSGSGQARPAYTKPAFKSRPSLPSLRILSEMNIVLPVKVRKGKVGAGLPSEPWRRLHEKPLPERPPSPAQELPEGILWELPNLSSSAGANNSFEMNFLDLSDTDMPPISENRDISAGVPTITKAAEPVLPAEPEQTSESSPLHDTPGVPLSSLFLHPESASSSTSLASTIMPHRSSHARLSNSTPVPGAFTADTSLADIASSSRYPSFVEDGIDSDTLSSPADYDYYSASSHFVDDSVPTSAHGSEPTTPPPEPAPAARPDSGVSAAFSSDSQGAQSEPEIRSRIRDAAMEQLKTHHRFASVQEALMVHVEQLADSDGHGQGHDKSGTQNGAGRHNGKTNNVNGSGQAHSQSTNGAPGGFDGEGGHEDDDDPRRPPFRRTSDFDSESEYSSSDEDDESLDGGHEGEHARHVRESSSMLNSSADDDVPLAQRIPTALQAQHSLRRQVRDERRRRKADHSRHVDPRPPMPLRQTVHPLPNGAALPQRPEVMSSSQEAALHATISRRRPRTQTMPSLTECPFTPDDLARRLMNVQASGTPPTAVISAGLGVYDDTDSGSREVSKGQFDDFAFLQQDPATVNEARRERILRPARSFHRSAPRSPELDRSYHLPSDFGRGLNRGASTNPVSRTRSRDVSPRQSEDKPVLPELPARPAYAVDENKLPRDRGRASRRTSAELDGVSIKTRSTQRQELPPQAQLSEPVPSLAKVVPKVQLTQQRIFVGDAQRFCMVEISSSTTAAEVLHMVHSQSGLDDSSGSGGWMLWEIAQDFGMERPIRSFETLSHVSSSWNMDKLVNMFMIRRTPLASILSRSAIPPSSPTHRGYVEWETKRGKWNKRWLELREHSLWVSKRDTGKDETFLCSLQNFDAYYVKRVHKSPKPFVFAVRSTENLALFENAADYLHVFSCGQKEGEKWVENILIARSYLMHQERHVIASGKSIAQDPTGLNISRGLISRALSRSGTRKLSAGQKPSQPLVTVPPPYSASAVSSPSAAFFEPGSLLAKKA